MSFRKPCHMPFRKLIPLFTLTEQQLTDGGILANRNGANHSYCFLSNQKKVQILAFLHVIRQTNVSCPLSVRDIKG